MDSKPLIRAASSVIALAAVLVAPPCVSAAEGQATSDTVPERVRVEPSPQLQVNAVSVRAYLDPDETSLAVAEIERGRLLTILEQRGEWFRVQVAPDPTKAAWVLRKEGEYGEPTVDVLPIRGIPRLASEDMGTGQEPDAQEGRYRPGNVPRKVVTLPPVDPDQLRPPEANLPRESVPIPDRWRLMQALGFKFPWYDPYNQNELKGDIPIKSLGEDVFFNLGLISDNLAEFRKIPTPVSQTTSFDSGSTDIFGNPHQNILATTLIASFGLIKGNTTYKPPEWEFRFTPVLNFNRVEAREAGALRADPLDCSGTHGGSVGDPGGSGEGDVASNAVLRAKNRCRRRDDFIGIQELFFDYHLRNVSDRYDFDSIRVGIQPFTSDFRGFLFQDLPFGVRLFGNRDNNRWQYNVGWFRRLEKDTNSGLNDTFRRWRNDDTFVVNAYRQDWPLTGFTSQATILHNRNNEQYQYVDKNGFVQRPAQVGSVASTSSPYHVTYVGYSGDGHLSFLWPRLRLNLSTSTYLAVGKQDFNAIAGRETDVLGFFHASEVSRDFSWVRLRGSFLYSSGDRNPADGRATGFDAIFENPQFAGADTSYWIRQNIPLIGGGGIALSGRNGVIPSLRTSKEQGQSNFVNPGLVLLGAGADFDVSPQVRVITNINHLNFDNVGSLEYLRVQNLTSNEIGWDFSAGVQWRPYYNQNVIINASAAVLKAGDGLKQLFGDGRHDVLYTGLINAIFAF